jgi:hypothetical protein
MRWTMLVLNIIAAIAFMMLAGLATVAHRTHAYSTYRELEVNGALVAKPTYKKARRLMWRRDCAKSGAVVIIPCSATLEQPLV